MRYKEIPGGGYSSIVSAGLDISDIADSSQGCWSEMPVRAVLVSIRFALTLTFLAARIVAAVAAVAFATRFVGITLI